VRDTIYPNSPVITDHIEKVLQRSALDIVDVGASFGPDGRWRRLHQFIRFITFEPDRRTFETSHRVVDGNFSFSCGLGSQSSQRPFYLTKFPMSSSTYKPNFGFLDSFPVSSLHEVIETSVMQVEALDQVLGQFPEVHATFLKIDVEGADLDVLSGSEKTLANDVLGVQVEASFSERNECAPFFLPTLIRTLGAMDSCFLICCENIGSARTQYSV
jgi:FkbM family methyltransferase